MTSDEIRAIVRALVRDTSPTSDEEVERLIAENNLLDDQETRRAIKEPSFTMPVVEGAIPIRVGYDARDALSLLEPIATGQSSDSIYAAASHAAEIWGALDEAESIYHRPHYYPADRNPLDDILDKLSAALASGPVDALTIVGLWAMFRDSARTHREVNATYHGLKGANNRHGQERGNREKKRKLLTIWKSGKYATKDQCAEKECGNFGVSFSTARKWLQGT